MRTGHSFTRRHYVWTTMESGPCLDHRGTHTLVWISPSPGWTRLSALSSCLNFDKTIDNPILLDSLGTQQVGRDILTGPSSGSQDSG